MWLCIIKSYKTNRRQIFTILFLFRIVGTTTLLRKNNKQPMRPNINRNLLYFETIKTFEKATCHSLIGVTA